MKKLYLVFKILYAEIDFCFVVFFSFRKYKIQNNECKYKKI